MLNQRGTTANSLGNDGVGLRLGKREGGGLIWWVGDGYVRYMSKKRLSVVNQWFMRSGLPARDVIEEEWGRVLAGSQIQKQC
jgi:hypothetical protein